MKENPVRIFYIWVVFLLIILPSPQLKAQVLGLELLDGKKEIEIDFNYEQGFILLDLKFSNTLPLKFILDTGAEHVILFKKEISDILGLEYEKRINLIGSDLDKEVYALISRNVALQLKKCKSVVRDIIVLEEDFLHLEELTGEAIHGILGSRFFRGLAIDIDYKRQKVKLIDASDFKIDEREGYEAFPIRIERHKPYLTANVTLEDGVKLDVNLLIDTGAALPFLIFTNSHPSLQIPENFIKGNLGKGLGGELEGYLSKLPYLQITEQHGFNNIITSFQDLPPGVTQDVYNSRNGLIGNPILERFNVIIDFVGSIIYLKPKRKYNRKFKYDKSGLTIYAFGPQLNQYYVKSVVKDSPAWQAGIRKGDMIKRFGPWPANFYSLGGITKRLQRKDGKKIKLKMERNGVEYKTQFFLRDILKSGQKISPESNK